MVTSRLSAQESVWGLVLLRKLLPGTKLEKKKGMCDGQEISSSRNMHIFILPLSFPLCLNHIYFQSYLVLICVLIKLVPLGCLCCCIVEEMGLFYFMTDGFWISNTSDVVF